MSPPIRTRAQAARHAARRLATTSTRERNAALEAIAQALETHRERLLEANAQDLEAAAALVEKGELARPLLERLNLSKKFARTVEMVRSLAAQPDPLGRTQRATELDEGLRLFRVSVPIGVIGVIFESRPDALVQIASVCLKAGNAVLLKGGREAARSNLLLAGVLAEATQGGGAAAGWITLLESREEVAALLELDEWVDLIIPRGSKEFVRYIMSHTRIPVMGHAEGICHVYVDRAAALDKAVRVVVDSKTQDASTCCAAETLLVHAQIAPAFLPRVVPALREQQVEIRGDRRTLALAGSGGELKAATEEDWRREYLDYIFSVKVVDSLEEAVEHINHYGSHHTDAIITEDKVAAAQFLRAVDAASVMHNASTRFADGFRYGLGAEVGISTNRIHSRGPVGLEGLTIYKYLLEGEGHIVGDYEGENPRPYAHRKLEEVWEG